MDKPRMTIYIDGSKLRKRYWKKLQRNLGINIILRDFIVKVRAKKSPLSRPLRVLWRAMITFAGIF